MKATRTHLSRITIYLEGIAEEDSFEDMLLEGATNPDMVRSEMVKRIALELGITKGWQPLSLADQKEIKERAEKALAMIEPVTLLERLETGQLTPADAELVKKVTKRQPNKKPYKKKMGRNATHQRYPNLVNEVIRSTGLSVKFLPVISTSKEGEEVKYASLAAASEALAGNPDIYTNIVNNLRRTQTHAYDMQWKFDLDVLAARAQS